MPYLDPEKQREARRRHYRKNRKAFIARAKVFNIKARKRNAEFVRAHLERHPCVDCGEPDPIVLEFDHVRGKKVKPVTRLETVAVSLKTLATEIEKTDVRCANCHRRRHNMRVTRKRVADAG